MEGLTLISFFLFFLLFLRYLYNNLGIISCRFGFIFLITLSWMQCARRYCHHQSGVERKAVSGCVVVVCLCVCGGVVVGVLWWCGEGVVVCGNVCSGGGVEKNNLEPNKTA